MSTILKQGMGVTTAASEADTSQMSTVTGFTLNTTEPSGTVMKYVAKVAGGTWKKYNTSTSAWVDVATQAVTSTSILAEGNTTTEMKSIPASAMSTFLGKKVDIAFACSMDDTATTAPTMNEPIKIAGKSGAEVHEETYVSSTYTLTSVDKAVEIISIDVKKTEVGGGTITVNGMIQDDNGSWGNWTDVSALVTSPATKAKAIKFQVIATAPTIGTSEAALAKVVVKHRTDNMAVFAEGNGYCVTKTLTLTRDMSRAHLMIKHPVIEDTAVKAYISLRQKPVEVVQEVLGVGDGKQHTYILKHPTKIAEHTLAVYFDENVQKDGYSFSSADGSVTCTAPTGKSVTADYSYNWEAEKFVAMEYDAQYQDALNANMVNDQFDYVKSTDTDPTGAVTSIKMELVQGKGSVVDEALGEATGSLQSYVLAHKAKEETMTVKVGGVPTANYTYRPLTKTLFVTGAVGATVTASYDWVADPVYLDNFYVVWNE